MKTDRLTISLADGQRKALKKIAVKRHASLASVIRCALEQFIKSDDGSAQNTNNRQGLPKGK
jgi:predicted transcriptional regulator